jgi:hypothetical protein
MMVNCEPLSGRVRRERTLIVPLVDAVPKHLGIKGDSQQEFAGETRLIGRPSVPRILISKHLKKV